MSVLWRKGNEADSIEPPKVLSFKAPDRSGFSLIELVVTIGLIAILAAIVIPMWFAYVPAATLNGAARQVQSGLTQARMLAISTRQSTCVEVVPPTGYRYRQNPGLPNTCAGPVVTPVTGADGTGTFWAFTSNNIRLAGPVSPIFTQFGTASQAAVFTVTGPQGRTLTVTVVPSGRVSIP